MGTAEAPQPDSSSAPPVPAGPKRGLYLGAMVLGALMGVGAAVLAAVGLGGPREAAMFAAAAVAAGAAPTFVPALLSGRGGAYFGVAVVGASMARMLLTLGIGLGLDQTRDLARQPYWGGIVAGVLVILVIESVVAVMILSKMQRRVSERA